MFISGYYYLQNQTQKEVISNQSTTKL